MVRAWNPTNLKEALRIKEAYPHAQVYAGGTDWMIHPDKSADILFINQIPELKNLSRRKQDGPQKAYLSVGSACTHADIAAHPDVPELLKKAAGHIASPGIRNMGTLGGNICNASPAGDTLPILYLYDARVVLSALDPHNTVRHIKRPVSDFILGAKRVDIQPWELLTGVEIDLLPFSHIVYQKIGARKAQAISKLSFAGAANLEKGVLLDFRVAFGSVGPVVLRKPELERQVLREGFSADITGLYDHEIHPIDDQRSTKAYRKRVCVNLLEDFWKQCMREGNEHA